MFKTHSRFLRASTCLARAASQSPLSIQSSPTAPSPSLPCRHASLGDPDPASAAALFDIVGSALPDCTAAETGPGDGGPEDDGSGDDGTET